MCVCVCAYVCDDRAQDDEETHLNADMWEAQLLGVSVFISIPMYTHTHTCVCVCVCACVCVRGRERERECVCGGVSV